MAFRWIVGVSALLGGLWFSSGVAEAQSAEESATNDTTARAHFELARAAFEATDYEKALEHFREAYELSDRAELQYNIGVTAGRLRRDGEALEAFERYLAELDYPARGLEVQARIDALRPAIEQKQAFATTRSPSPSDFGRIPRSAIVGSSILAVVGVTGITAMGVGLARSGECLDEVAGECLARRTSSPWVGVYGAVGIAALAGSAIWLGVGSKRAKEKRSTAWMLTPTGVVVSGSF